MFSLSETRSKYLSLSGLDEASMSGHGHEYAVVPTNERAHSGPTSPESAWSNSPDSPEFANLHHPPEEKYGRIDIQAPPTYTYRNQLRTPFAKLWCVVIILASIFSTAFSWTWFALAATCARFPGLGQPGHLSVQDMSTLIAAGAKAIELSFVLICSTCIGQELSRRAVHVSRHGVTVSEVQLKFFLAQPGAIVSNLRAFCSIILSWLGIFTFVAAVVATLFTTASDSLVSPKASIKNPTMELIPANISTEFINTTHVGRSCPYKVSVTEDWAETQDCNDIQQNALSYHNLILYLSDFTIQESVPDPLLITQRPPARTLDLDLTYIEGVWLNDSENQTVIDNENRMINNVTLLMPHAGVVAAAKAFGSGYSPQDANGAGELDMSASVITPALNVLCAEMDEGPTLDTITIAKWPKALNESSLHLGYENVSASWYNGTDFDDFWHFSKDHRPPAFINLPGPRNTRISWSPDTNNTMYILARDPFNHLFMCGISARLQQGCSTIYNWTISSGNLSLNCDPSNEMGYSLQPGEAGIRPVTPESHFVGEFVFAAHTWGNAIGLAQTADVNGSLETILTELWPQSDWWNSTRPTFAESLAVLASSLIVSGSHDAPLADPVNDYGKPIAALNHSWPISTSFNAMVSISDYAAGGSGQSQRAFYLILILASVLNTLCLFYLVAFIVKDGNLLHDFFEPHSLFGLALNSERDPLLAPARPLELDPRQLKQRWVVSGTAHSVHIETLDRHRPRRSHRRSALAKDLRYGISGQFQRLRRGNALGRWYSGPLSVQSPFGYEKEGSNIGVARL